MRPEPALHRSTLRASYGCFATALGARVSDSVPERAFYLGSPLIPQHHGGSNTSRHHVLGGLPRAVCCCRRHSVGWYGLNADRFSSGQSPEFTGLLPENDSAATLTGLATEGPANIA